MEEKTSENFGDVEVASIIGFRYNIVAEEYQSTLYLDKKSICLKITEMMAKEVEKLKESIDEDTFVEEATEERDSARKALDDFYFDRLGGGLKVQSPIDERKYHVPTEYRIFTFTLKKADITRIINGEGFTEIYQNYKGENSTEQKPKN